MLGGKCLYSKTFELTCKIISSNITKKDQTGRCNDLDKRNLKSQRNDTIHPFGEPPTKHSTNIQQ